MPFQGVHRDPRLVLSAGVASHIWTDSVLVGNMDLVITTPSMYG